MVTGVRSVQTGFAETGGVRYGIGMPHTIRKKKALTLRVARIRGQVEALGRAFDGDPDCGEVLALIASARGAMDGLMAEVIEAHIRDHVFRDARVLRFLKETPSVASAPVPALAPR